MFTNAKVILLNNECIRLGVVTDITVYCDGKLTKHYFYVLPILRFDVLLGLDFCRHSQITIEFRDTILELPRYSVEVDDKYDVKLISETVIPRRSYIALSFTVPSNEKYGIFKPTKEMFDRYTIDIKSQVIDLTQEFKIWIFNPLLSNVILHKNKRIGKIRPLPGWTFSDNEEEEKDYCLLSEMMCEQENEIEFELSHHNEKLNDLLNEFKHLFAKEISQIKRATDIQHVINTGDAKPIRSVPYKTSPAEKNIIKTQVTEMLENKIIEESNGPWSSPVVLVKKKDGKYRFCVDYRKLNAVTIRDSGPLPLIADTIEALNRSKVFSKLDLKSGYWAISMAEESKAKTSFITYMGLFQFLVLPFGLSNAPATFQRYLQKTLQDILWKCCLCYIDDIIIYSENVEQHLEHIRMVFERLDKHNLRLNPDKCEFLKEEIGYLGHIVSANGVKPDSEKVISISKFPQPRKVRDIRCFLGMTGYYRNFIQGYATIAKPLTQLLKNEQAFEWTTECQSSFELLKQKLMEAPILRHFREDCKVVIHTDASGYAMGAILCQIQDEKEVVISYNSKTFDELQLKYSVSEKEALAIVWAVKKLRHYIFGSHFTIKTDNCALCFIMSIKNPNGRLARWSLLLQEFDFTVEYRSGKKHSNVDCLSRYPIEASGNDFDEFPLLFAEATDVHEAQKSDSWCRDVSESLKTGKAKSFLNKFRIENEVLYRVTHDSNGQEKLLLCVPKSMRRKILQELHDDPTAGHLGFIKTYIKVRDRFFWKHIERTVRKYVSNCTSCQRWKADVGLPKGNLQSIEYPSEPFSLVGIDILGSLSVTSRRKKYIIVLIDFCTRYIEAESLAHIRSDAIADWFINKIVLRHGAIRKVISDQGRSFCSEFTEAVFKLTKSQHVMATPYHPETNGLVERSIRTIRSMLGHYVNQELSNWDLILPKVVFAYNTSQQKTTKESPFKLLYNRDPILPIDVTLKLPKRFLFGEKYKKSMENCRELVKIRVQNAQERQKSYYNERHKNVRFEINELVGLYTPSRELGLSEKLLPKFTGPYRVIKRLTPVTYEIQDINPPRKKRQAHIKRLKRWNVEEIEELEKEIVSNIDATNVKDKDRKRSGNLKK